MMPKAKQNSQGKLHYTFALDVWISLFFYKLLKCIDFQARKRSPHSLKPSFLTGIVRLLSVPFCVGEYPAFSWPSQLKEAPSPETGKASGKLPFCRRGSLMAAGCGVELARLAVWLSSREIMTFDDNCLCEGWRFIRRFSQVWRFFFLSKAARCLLRFPKARGR